MCESKTIVENADNSKDHETLVADDGGEHPVKTVGGCTLTAMADEGSIMLKDGQGNVAHVTIAHVAIADVKQSNGVIHVIDHVLLPES